MNDNEQMDLKKISLDIVRELYSASRKLVMYPLGHPQTNETLKKSLERMNEVFAVKRSFSLQVFSNRLAAEGILLEESVFVNGLLLDLKRHELESVMFLSELLLGDLYHFLSKLLDSKSPLPNYFQKFLDSKGISTININVARPPTLYDFNSAGHALANTRFMVSHRIQELVRSNPRLAALFYSGSVAGDKVLTEFCGVDLRAGYVKSRMSEIISAMSDEELAELFSEIARSGVRDRSEPDQKLLRGLAQLWNDCSDRADKNDFWLLIHERLKESGIKGPLLEQVFDKSTLTRVNILSDFDELEIQLRQESAARVDAVLLRTTAKKLLAAGMDQRVESMFKLCLNWLNSPIEETRQKGARLLTEIIYITLENQKWESTSKLIKEILCGAVSSKSGTEIVELIEKAVEIAAMNGRWAELKYALQSLKGLAGDTRSNKEMAAAAKLAALRQSSVLLDILSEAVISGKGGSDLYDSIATLGSPKLASIFIEKVDCPGKETRARLIRALAAMGKEAGPQATESLSTVIGAGEKNDDRTWWRIRNLLRILGTIKYQEAIPYFEIVAGWKQKRIKLELIGTLEALQSPIAGPLLSRLAEEKDVEIRRAAIAAMGNSGHPDMAGYLKNLLLMEKTDHLPIIASLGRLGGAKARDILIDFYENDDHIQSLELGKKEEDNLRMAIIKSLSKIGDEISTSKVDQFSKQWLSKSSRKGDLLTSTAKLLLGEIAKGRE